MRIRTVALIVPAFAWLCFAAGVHAEPSAPVQPGAFLRSSRDGRAIILESAAHARIRVTPYGAYMLRVQVVRADETFRPDDWLPMIERHDVPGELHVAETPEVVRIATDAAHGVVAEFAKSNLAARWTCNAADQPQLVERDPPQWSGDDVTLSFVPDAAEHFAGLGHGFYGRDAAPLDLRGRTISRSYGFQAALVTPWFLSSKGYGFFLNCAFPNRFRFGVDGRYDVSVEGTGVGARLDYVVVAGRTPLELIDRYTQLTGRPRLPRKAMFGLQVSDKPHEAESLKQGMSWWFENLPKLRRAGFPTDAIIMDNTWRAGGGTWGDSIFAFDRVHYPDPRAFREWGEREGVMMDVDFNGPMYVQSEGWKPEFGVRGGKWRNGNFYLPNFFDPKVDHWLWALMWRNVLDPRLGYPNDMLWMDETDQATVDNERAPFWQDRPWMELKNLYAFAGARALVADWDRDFRGTKRPYIWFRTATSGMQRECVYWSGDTDGNESDQSAQITAMLAAGISGFPYFNHDAGGWQYTSEPIYRRYGLVAGSLSPVWRLHGIRGPRWPIDYGPDVQALAHAYADLRYRLYPYLYSIARRSTVTGEPMARALFLDWPAQAEAWRRDYEYLFGPAILAAPPVASRHDVWLPPGRWYGWWDGRPVDGGRSVPAPAGDDAGLYVRAGSVVPMVDFFLSSAFIPKEPMQVHVWVGADGAFDLYEDDGLTEAYRQGEYRLTRLHWDDARRTLHIATPEGHWSGGPNERQWTIVFHGLEAAWPVEAGGRSVSSAWDSTRHVLTIKLSPVPSTKSVDVALGADH